MSFDPGNTLHVPNCGYNAQKMEYLEISADCNF